MVKHIILWTLKPEYSDIKKAGIKNGIKRGLESLNGKIEGLTDINVYTNPLETSSCDVMLDATFEDFASLKAYSKNPLHVEVADSKVRPYTLNRVCMDFEI